MAAVLHRMQPSANEQHGEKTSLHLWGTQWPSKDNRGHECTSMGVNINLQVNENRWLIKAMTFSRNWVNTKKTRNQRSEPQYFIGKDEDEQRGKAPRRQMGSTSVHSVSCHGSLSKYKKKSNDHLSSKTTKDGTIKDHHWGWGVDSVISIFFSLWDAWGSIFSSTLAGSECPVLSNRNGVGNSDRITKDLSQWEFKGSDTEDDGNNEDTGWCSLVKSDSNLWERMEEHKLVKLDLKLGERMEEHSLSLKRKSSIKSKTVFQQPNNSCRLGLKYQMPSGDFRPLVAIHIQSHQMEPVHNSYRTTTLGTDTTTEAGGSLPSHLSLCFHLDPALFSSRLF